jgi:hypothetical protein
MLVPVLALGAFVFSTALRVRHIEFVSDIGTPPTAGSEWRPKLIVPGHHNESYEWLDQTRQMFATGDWRVRHVDYENAPIGHDVSSASPYRWWLGLIAWVDHELTGYPLGRCIEAAAVVADPLILILLAIVTVTYVARCYGALSATLLSVGLVTIFPFASIFLPGSPDYSGLSVACALWSILLVLAGITAGNGDTREFARKIRLRFLGAGIVGGVGMWISVSSMAPILVGIGLGALIAASAGRIGLKAGRGLPSEDLPWRLWALGGALTCLFAYLAEYFPGHLGNWEFRSIHPLFGLAWLGGADLVARASSWVRRPGRQPSIRDLLLGLLSISATLSLPFAMWRAHDLGFLTTDPHSMRLSMLPESEIAPSFLALLLQNGFTPAICFTLLPLLILVPAVWLLSNRSLRPWQFTSIAVSLGPVLMALAFAFREISWWSRVDCALLAMMVVSAAAMRETNASPVIAWVGGTIAAIAVLPGSARLWPALGSETEKGFTETEVVTLIERDLAYWLSNQAGTSDVVALAPPDATIAMYYYGQIRGLGTFGWENRNGLGAAVRIISASTPEESRELIGQRNVTHIVFPSWDPYMDAYARLGEGQVEGTFLERLRQWNLPPWLRPVPYLLPMVSGFEGRSVAVLEVVDDQNDAVAASRLAEYFVDMGQLDLAAGAGIALRSFRGAPGAVLAQAEIAIERGDQEAFASTVEELLRRISGGADRSMPWDQKVRLCIVLVRAHQIDLARVRLKQCLDEINDAKVRLLGDKTLFRFELLQKSFGLEIADPRVRATALELLPPDLRSRIASAGH